MLFAFADAEKKCTVLKKYSDFPLYDRRPQNRFQNELRLGFLER